MFVLKTVKIRSYEVGLYFRDGEFKGLLGPGRQWLFNPLLKVRVHVVSQRDAWLTHDKLDMIVKSGALADRAVTLDLKDYERGLVWVENRFSHVLPPGLYAYWRNTADAKVVEVDAATLERQLANHLARDPLPTSNAVRPANPTSSRYSARGPSHVGEAAARCGRMAATKTKTRVG